MPSPSQQDALLAVLGRMMEQRCGEIAERLEDGRADADDRSWLAAVLKAPPVVADDGTKAKVVELFEALKEALAR